jgi:hypothetical protein
MLLGITLKDVWEMEVLLSAFIKIYLSIPVYAHLEHRASVKLFVSLQFLNLRQSVGPLGRGISPT